MRLFKKSEAERIAQEIRNGSTDVHPDLFKRYAGVLQKGVSGVFNSDAADDKHFGLQQKLELNAGRFAAAKAYQATQLIRRQSSDQDGATRSEDDFMKRSQAVIGQFGAWLETERNAAIARSRSAMQWQEFTDDPEKNELFPNLRWLPSRSVTLRPEHQAYYNRVWAKTDPFWQNNMPGSLWNCGCDMEETDDPADGGSPDIQPAKGLKGNPAETGEIFSPDASCFTQNANAAIAKLHYGDRLSSLQISVIADKREIADNVRTGRILLDNFKDMELTVREHVLDGRKNPEYTLNGMRADAKRTASWNVSAGFKSAIVQKCRAVIIDLHHMQKYTLNSDELAKNIVRRYNDFMSGKIDECYVVWNNKSILIKKEFFRDFKWSDREKYKKQLVNDLTDKKKGEK